jgi:hypothetical protein
LANVSYPRLFNCTYPGCTKAYIHKQHLDRHKLSHTRVEIPCTLCPQVLASRANLVSHMKTHDLGIHYNCSACHLTFKRRIVCAKHITTANCSGTITLINLTRENRENYTIVSRSSNKQIGKLLKTTRLAKPPSVVKSGNE